MWPKAYRGLPDTSSAVVASRRYVVAAEVGVVEISDWGGFERFVAELHRTGEVEVQHDVKLTGMMGVPRQIDILVIHRTGPYRHLILIECKFWQERIKRSHVDAMVTAVHDLGASKGVFFTVKGAQRGAKTLASKTGIEIFMVAEPTPEEWGLPGRIIDFWMHLYSRSIGNLAFPGAVTFGPAPGSLHLAIRLGDKRSGWSTTPTILPSGAPGPTLEETLDKVSMKALQQCAEQIRVFRGGVDCEDATTCNVEYRPPEPLVLLVGGRRVQMPQISFTLGVHILQRRFVHDRARRYLFVRAVENCVTGERFIAHRRSDEAVTTHVPATLKDGDDVPSDDVLRNGSLMRVFTSIWNHALPNSAVPMPSTE